MTTPKAGTNFQGDEFYFPVVTEKEFVPVENRKYEAVALALVYKGKQRQIVADILREAKSPMSVAEVAVLAESKGLHAVGGVLDSCRYHLHNLAKLGQAKLA